ncbi:MAG: (d)CMP kinase, partial [Gammaproteobacteria bacterium]
VRKALLKVQQDFAMPPGLVADGRDMGTVVFPLADVKLFLVATSEERAERRYKQLKNNNISVEYDNVLKEIEARDKRDSSRSVAPLRAADDAMTIDTTGIDANAVLSQVRDFVKKQLIQ